MMEWRVETILHLYHWYPCAWSCSGIHILKCCYKWKTWNKMPYNESLQEHKPLILLKRKAEMCIVYRLLPHSCGNDKILKGSSIHGSAGITWQNQSRQSNTITVHRMQPLDQRVHQLLMSEIQNEDLSEMDAGRLKTVQAELGEM